MTALLDLGALKIASASALPLRLKGGRRKDHLPRSFERALRR